MKSRNISLIFTISLLFLFSISKGETLPKKWETITFKVYGNCGMCKSTIEGSLKNIEGVKFAVWSATSKKITVKYNPKIISLDEIHSKIAAVGYDTEKVSAKDEVYNELHGCCKYERPKK